MRLLTLLIGSSLCASLFLVGCRIQSDPGSWKASHSDDWMTISPILSTPWKELPISRYPNAKEQNKLLTLLQKKPYVVLKNSEQKQEIALRCVNELFSNKTKVSARIFQNGSVFWTVGNGDRNSYVAKRCAVIVSAQSVPQKVYVSLFPDVAPK